MSMVVEPDNWTWPDIVEEDEPPYRWRYGRWTVLSMSDTTAYAVCDCSTDLHGIRISDLTDGASTCCIRCRARSQM
jgi:hypothetical protein